MFISYYLLSVKLLCQGILFTSSFHNTLKSRNREPQYSEFCKIVNKTQFPFWGFTKHITFDIVNYSILWTKRIWQTCSLYQGLCVLERVGEGWLIVILSDETDDYTYTLSVLKSSQDGAKCKPLHHNEQKWLQKWHFLGQKYLCFKTIFVNAKILN